MKTTRENLSDLDFRYTIKVETSDYTEPYEKALARVVKNYKKQGFRKGKVPVTLVEKEVGNQILMNVVNDLLQKEFERLRKEDQLIGPFVLDAENSQTVQTRTATFTFTLFNGANPTFEISTENIPALKDYSVKFTDGLIAQTIDNYKKHNPEQTVEMSEDDLRNKALANLRAFYENQAELRLYNTIKEEVLKANDFKTPDIYLKAYLLNNNPKTTKEVVDAQYASWLKQFKWDMISQSILSGVKLDVEEASKKYVLHRFKALGFPEISEEIMQNNLTELKKSKYGIEQATQWYKGQMVIDHFKSKLAFEIAEITSDEFDKL